MAPKTPKPQRYRPEVASIAYGDEVEYTAIMVPDNDGEWERYVDSKQPDSPRAATERAIFQAVMARMVETGEMDRRVMESFHRRVRKVRHG